MIVTRVRLHTVAAIAVVMAASFSRPAAAQIDDADVDAVSVAGLLPVDEFSPAFLGMYRKVMEIDEDVRRYSNKYGVDLSLARAVCMYESGGNANLTSSAGARGYFQVMPATFRLMRVPTNVEAGIKYLGQLVKQFGREDYALAAYNGGPGRVARGRGMPLESLQYVLGVGAYRSVLKMYEPAVRAHASALGLVRSHKGDTWWTLSERLDVPVVQLRLYNPFLTDARLRVASYLIAYPKEPAIDFANIGAEGGFHYRVRIGDNYINLAFAFGVGVDELRQANELWRLQPLPRGMLLSIPSAATMALAASDVSSDDDVVRASAPPVVQARSSRPTYTTHRVKRGENLTTIARRYGTTIAAIQRANALGRRTVIHSGARLRIPRR
jgi:LysM repeat protein